MNNVTNYNEVQVNRRWKGSVYNWSIMTPRLSGDLSELTWLLSSVRGAGQWSHFIRHG